MVSDFMICIDRLIASTNCFHPLDAESTGASTPVAVEVEGCSEARKVATLECIAIAAAVKKSVNNRGGDVVECRICQEEGDNGEMEAPCACNGTLKFAHRKCIQKWCNKKGDITCEICNQVFVPNYFVPPSRPSAAVMTIDIRQSWDSHIDLNDSHYIAIAAADQELLSAEYEDYDTDSSNGISCGRAAILILMIMLLILHILLATREIGTVHDISSLFSVLLEFVGFFVPCFVIARSCFSIQSRRRRQV